MGFRYDKEIEAELATINAKLGEVGLGWELGHRYGYTAIDEHRTGEHYKKTGALTRTIQTGMTGQEALDFVQAFRWGLFFVADESAKIEGRKAWDRQREAEQGEEQGAPAKPAR